MEKIKGAFGSFYQIDMYYRDDPLIQLPVFTQDMLLPELDIAPELSVIVQEYISPLPRDGFSGAETFV
jgi:hypothetical protein